MLDIKSTSGQLMDQATETASLFLTRAIKRIDEALGKDAAKKNPELIVAFLRTAAADFTASVMAKAITDSAVEIVGAIDRRLEE